MIRPTSAGGDVQRREPQALGAGMRVSAGCEELLAQQTRRPDLGGVVQGRPPCRVRRPHRPALRQRGRHRPRIHQARLAAT